jgi:opacity protein-like surface antigen
MKKLFIAAFAVFALTTAQAQKSEDKGSGMGFSKGSIFVTGALSVGSANDKNTDVKTSGFEIEPKIGFFVTENIAVGAKLGYASGKVKSAGTTTSDMSGFSAGAFGRYYFTPANQFSLFANLGLDYANTTNNLSTPKVKYNDFTVGLGAGLNYFVSNNFSLEAGVAVLDFTSSKSDISGDKGSTSVNFGGDWRSGVTFGVNYKF